MPISNENLNKKLYDLLKTQGFDPIPKNSKGDTTPVPNDADVFRFTFKVDGKPIGPAWVTVDSNRELKVYYDDKVMDGLQEDGGENHIDDFTEFLQQLKHWAQRRQLGFDLENQDHLESDMAQREHVKKQEQINEGYYPMGKSASYSDSVPSIKIILQHTRQIQEGEQRFRNIARIFLENSVGERILAPTVRPGIAKVYARHLAEGGLPHDDRWSHIGSLVEEYTKMAGFVRAIRNGQFNESAQQLVDEGVEHYHQLRETLSRMIGHRGYNSYFDSYTPALMETEGDESLNELFVQETLDPRIESVMPILSRIHKKVNEMNEVKELEEWANKIIDEEMIEETEQLNELEKSTLASYATKAADQARVKKDAAIGHVRQRKGMVSTGEIEKSGKADKRIEGIKSAIKRLAKEEIEQIDEVAPKGWEGTVKAMKKYKDEIDNPWALAHWMKGKGYKSHKKEDVAEDSSEEINPVINSIINRILKTNPELFKHGVDKVMAAIEDVAEFVGDVDEVGSSDVSGWVKEVEQQLGKAVDESLGPEQKRVGQLGPTEKVKNNNIGKLVGANESFINTDIQAVVTEEESRPYVCVHAKKGQCEVTANSSYEAAKKAAEKWNLKTTAGIDAYPADKPVDAARLKEGQEDLEIIKRLIGK